MRISDWSSDVCSSDLLLGLALGREAITLRLVAAGAFMILLILPEALIGASFQLSFAAVTAIVALHEVPWVRERLMRREEPWWAAFLRLPAVLQVGRASCREGVCHDV